MKSKQEYLDIIGLVEENLKGFLYSYDQRYVDNLVNELGRTPQEAKSFACWDWTHGVGLYGLYKHYEFDQNEEHLDYIERWFNDRIEIGLPGKNVNTVAPLLTMACLYEKRPNDTYEKIMLEWAEWIMHDMKRTEEGGIQHCHAELENNQELWDDTLLMTVLFLAKAGNIFKNSSYTSEAVYQFFIHTKYLVDTKTGLWYHGWSFLERDNFAGALWGRGNCWVTVFVPEFLELVGMPEEEKRYVLGVFENQVAALRKTQSDSGLWHTLLNDPSSYLEASGTAGFCFGILKGVRKGYIDTSYTDCGLRALQAIVQNINSDGELMQVSYGTNVGRTLEHYREIPLQKMHYGQALAMLALMEGLNGGFFEN